MSYNQMKLMEDLKVKDEFDKEYAKDVTGLDNESLGGLLSGLVRKGFIKALYYDYDKGVRNTHYLVIKK